MNIGSKYESLMKESATKKMEMERMMTKGKGYTFYAAKSGKLGIDL